MSESEAEVEKTPYWIKWFCPCPEGQHEWVAMGPEGEIGGFDDRIEALTATADAMGLTVEYVDMGGKFHHTPDDNYWMTVTPRSTPRPGPPYIPPTLDWQIKGLLEGGSPVVDTSKSAQYGYRGVVIDKGDRGFSVVWTVPPYAETDKTQWMTTSITGGSGLDLSKRAGRNRAIDWLCDRLDIANLMPTSPVFGAVGGGRWRLNIYPHTTINFDPAPGNEEDDVAATFIVPKLGEIPNPEETFEDGTFISDGEAIKAIVEWVYANPEAVYTALQHPSPYGIA